MLAFILDGDGGKGEGIHDAAEECADTPHKGFRGHGAKLLATGGAVDVLVGVETCGCLVSGGRDCGRGEDKLDRGRKKMMVR